MTTTNPSPFANPASQQQPAIADQYPMSGVDVMQNNFTGPRAALASYRNGTVRGGDLAKPMMVNRGGIGNTNGAAAMGPSGGGNLADIGIGGAKDMPMRNPPGGTVPNAVGTSASMGGLPSPGTGAIASGQQTMQAGGGNYLTDLASGPRNALATYRTRNPGAQLAGVNAGGMGPGRVRPPGVMRPTRA